MKIVYNNIIPFKGFIAVNIFGILFVRKEYRDTLSKQTLNHEAIHTEQIKELLGVFFYIWYIVEWFIKLFKYGKKSYKNISFEREAYSNENNLKYLSKRKRFRWLYYLTHKADGKK